MNYKIIIGICVLLVGVLLFFMWPKKSGKELELTYELNAGIPYKWVYEIEDPSVTEFVRSYVLKDDNTGSIVGASVYTNYVFKGLKEGFTTITFKCISITDEADVWKEEKTKVKVDKDNNISIVVESNEQ